jgi:hypothetical protein
MQINPVFIMGCQRSGTTMLASQLGRAKNVIAFPEMQFIHKLISRDYREKYSAEEAYRTLCHDFRYKTSGLKIDAAEFCKYYINNDLSLLLLKLIEANSNLGSTQTSLVWIEHNPQNRDKVNELKDCFPNAKFIHIVRDPRSIYWSMKSNPRWNIGEPLTFTAFWNQAVSQGYLYSREYLDSCIEVSYEHFVKDTAKELKRLCEFISIDYSDEMLTGGGVKLPEFTKYQHAFTEKPSDPSRIELWKGKLTSFEEQIICSRCYDWMYQYNYLDRNRIVRVLSTTEKITCFLKKINTEFVYRVVSKAQNWFYILSNSN